MVSRIARRWAFGGHGALGGPFRSHAHVFTQRRSFSVEQLKQSLLLHPQVSRCVFIENVAYVVRKENSATTSILDDSLTDWELEKYLRRKATAGRIPQSLVPQVRVLDELPAPESFVVPFSLLHMLHVLFQEVDVSRNNHICLAEFIDFCKSFELFTADEASQVFLSKRSMPTTSEILFSENDIFNLDESDKAMKFNDFQQLILDAGIVDLTSFRAIGDPLGTPLVSFFVDERVLKLILTHWFKIYDVDQDGQLQLEDYARLVADYQLPLTAADEIYTRVAKERLAGLDFMDFQSLLVKSSVLATGTSVDKDDEMGRLWRQMETSQQFLVPNRVFIADGRSGTSSPPASEGQQLRFVCLSDTHGQHRELSSRLPPGDVLLHGGDFSNDGSLEEVMDFAAWLRSLPYRHKVLIGGNHELTFDQNYGGDRVKDSSSANSIRSAFLQSFKDQDGITYLEDEELVISGVRIYGSPWQPEFLDWAFNLPRGDAIREKWKAIPTNVDVLLVHGPPLGRGDALVPSLKRRGCMDLLLEIQERIRPQFCVFGHIHEGAGVTFDGTTHFVNASSMNEHYQCIHAPLVFDIAIKQDTP